MATLGNTRVQLQKRQTRPPVRQVAVLCKDIRFDGNFNRRYEFCRQFCRQRLQNLLQDCKLQQPRVRNPTHSISPTSCMWQPTSQAAYPAIAGCSKCCTTWVSVHPDRKSSTRNRLDYFSCQRNFFRYAQGRILQGILVLAWSESVRTRQIHFRPLPVHASKKLIQSSESFLFIAILMIMSAGWGHREAALFRDKPGAT